MDAERLAPERAHDEAAAEFRHASRPGRLATAAVAGGGGAERAIAERCGVWETREPAQRLIDERLMPVVAEVAARRTDAPAPQRQYFCDVHEALSLPAQRSWVRGAWRRLTQSDLTPYRRRRPASSAALTRFSSPISQTVRVFALPEGRKG
jgi:hypothetical protein